MTSLIFAAYAKCGKVQMEGSQILVNNKTIIEFGSCKISGLRLRHVTQSLP